MTLERRRTRLDDCRNPEPLATVHYVDMFPDWDDAFSMLSDSIGFQRVLQESRKRSFTDSEPERKSPTMLLVNDEPAPMNAVVDNWKQCGLAVEYSFSVDQAIQMISAARPDVVVSDLSHFLGGECVTDRAAFDILTWANKQQFDLKLIVTCADLTGNRQSTSSELGAFGICNSAAELDRLVALATGVRVDHTYRSLESTKQSLETARELLESGSRRNVWWWTALFEQRLALLQTQMIHQSNVEPRATE